MINIDLWFKKQPVWLKVILLLIPGVSFVTEVLVRLSICLRKRSTVSIIMLVVGIVCAGTVLGVVDIIMVALTGDVLLADL